MEKGKAKIMKKLLVQKIEQIVILLKEKNPAREENIITDINNLSRG